MQGKMGNAIFIPSSHVLCYKTCELYYGERKMVTGGELAGCLGKSNDAMENIAECLRGPMFAFPSALSFP